VCCCLALDNRAEASDHPGNGVECVVSLRVLPDPIVLSDMRLKNGRNAGGAALLEEDGPCAIARDDDLLEPMGKDLPSFEDQGMIVLQGVPDEVLDAGPTGLCLAQ